MNLIGAQPAIQRTKQLNLIQVFRGIAALFVVGVHGELIFRQNLDQVFLFKIFHFGGSGVDFFFVLSGFIIYYIHQKDLGKSHKLKTFLLKRLVRIYPIYWIILMTKIMASISFNYANIYERNWLEVIKAITLFPQDREILSQSFLGVSWTLSYEIFFYIIFGLLIYFKPKFCLPAVAIWLTAVLLKFVGIFTVPEDSIILQFLFSQLHLEFAFGLLAAHIVSNYKIANAKKLIYIGIFLYTLAAINFNYDLYPISDVIIFAIPSTILVIGAAGLEMHKTINVPSFWILLGNASYSLYLVHGFVINNITKITVNLGLIDAITSNTIMLTLFALINAVAAVIVGCLIYLLIEKPLLILLRQHVVKRLT